MTASSMLDAGSSTQSLEYRKWTAIHERTAAKNVATVNSRLESMAGRIELAGLDQEYRTELVLEEFYPDYLDSGCRSSKCEALCQFAIFWRLSINSA